MGAVKSKVESTSNIVNEAITDVLMESSSSCQNNQTIFQEQDISDIKIIGCSLNIMQSATASLNLSCSQDTTQNSELATKFSNTLDKKLESSVKGIMIGLSDTEVKSVENLVNKVKNSINISNVASCVASTLINQKQKLGKIEVDCTKLPVGASSIVSFNQVVVSNAVAKCMQSNSAANQAITELDNKIKTAQSAQTVGLDLAALASSIIPCVICVFCSLSIVASVMMSQMQSQSPGAGMSASLPSMQSVSKSLMSNNLKF
jgi:hypothetical protein